MSRLDRFPRILVVDDHEDLQHLVGWIFRDLGYEVDLASEGWTAIEKLEARRPDLVLLDLLMPLVDGWGVLDYIHGMPSPPPVVALTACGDTSSFTRCVHHGVAAYIFKPFAVKNLVATCERILGLKKASDVHSERRHEPRRILAVDLAALSKQNARIGWAMLVDLSTGGAQVDLDAPLARGDHVRFALRIPDGQIPLSLEGRVEWRDAGPHGFSHGLVFDSLAAEEERQLRDLLWRA